MTASGQLSSLFAWPRVQPIVIGLCEHLWKHWRKYLVVILPVYVATEYIGFAINTTNSLPGKVFWIDKSATDLSRFQRGDLVTFRWHGGANKPRGIWFTKIVAGMPGDEVQAQGEDGRHISVAGTEIGYAKPTASSGGLKLLPIEPSRVPHRSMFVQGTHPDSLDSRYQITGFVHEAEIVGKAHRLW